MLRGYVAHKLHCYDLYKCMLRVHKMVQHSQLVQVGAPQHLSYLHTLVQARTTASTRDGIPAEQKQPPCFKANATHTCQADVTTRFHSPARLRVHVETTLILLAL